MDLIDINKYFKDEFIYNIKIVFLQNQIIYYVNETIITTIKLKNGFESVSIYPFIYIFQRIIIV